MIKKLWNKFKSLVKKIKDKVVNFVKNFTPSKYVKLYLGLIFLVAIVFFVYILLKHYGILDKFSSVEELTSILNSKYKALTIILYMLVQFLQVTVLPIPAFVTTAAGIAIFGNWYEPVIYSLAAIIPASLFSFMLGRLLGKPFVAWMVGKDNMKKYLNKTRGKENPIFFMMFLLPVFPDDILCMVAGITPMTFRFFLIMQIICRPPAVIGTILATYSVIDKGFFKTPLGIVIIVLLAIAFCVVVYLTIKYADRIEKFFVRKFSRKKKPQEYYAPRRKDLGYYLPQESSDDMIETD